MELKELYGMLDRFAASGLSELTWSKDGESVSLRREITSVVQAPTSAPASQAIAAPISAPAVDEGETIKAPLVGTFYAAPAPDEPPFVHAGKQVKKGDTVCLIEAMKMMSEVPAPCDGVIEAVLVTNGDAVGFGDVLFRMGKG